MASLRFYKYSKEDVSETKKDKFIENLKKYTGSLEEREWAVKDNSIITDSSMKSVGFTIIQKVQQEVSTIEGTKEFTFIEEIHLILFLEESILAVATTSKNLAQELKEYSDKILFNNNFKRMSIYLESSEELLSKLEEDNTIEVIGFDSRNAMGIDRLSGLDRYDIRNKKIFEEACSGTFTGKVGAKNFGNPIGKVKFCIRVNGLITIFKKNLTVQEISLIIKDLLKFLQNPTTFPPTLSSFV